ncbi:DUF3105 domain-containing protein [Nakamurella deserti]|uniref:DUF3105 domain-containing protein n=1 Tax=Nakamurella deserti TaxID=2164074 RepID=UPI001F0BD1EE|nr:DUF3105 domain-containing protein [Nakamurella deserti]
MMASGKNAKKARRELPVINQREGLPWLTITAVTVIVALAATIFFVVFNAREDKNQAAEVLAPFVPTAENQDPAAGIEGVFTGAADTYKVGLHVTPPTRVAYDRFPPVGGPHDAEWAACNGVVYEVPVRNENMVHTLEHGAIWITYNPDTIGDQLDTLRGLVEGKQYITLSPYPGLDSRISLQAWAHQLKVDSADDGRIQQFITALQRNQFLTPEVNGTCAQPTFDIANPPAFDATPPGADAVQMDGTGGASGAVVTQDSAEAQGETAPETGMTESGTADPATTSAEAVPTGDTAPAATGTESSDTAETTEPSVAATTG